MDVRAVLLKGSKTLVQENCRILLPPLKDPGNRCQETWRHTRASGFGYWPGSLSEALDPDLSSRGFESGTGAE